MGIKLDNLVSLLKILTWSKIAQAAIFLLVVGISYGLWENRLIIYNSLRVGARVETEEALIINLSPSSIAALEAAAKKSSPLVAGIQIVNVDFKKNIRSNSYFVFNDENLRKLYEDYQERKLTDAPLFTDKESSNQKIIDLLNGEFVCNDFRDTLMYAFISGIGNTVTTVCSISIPPYYGRFSGYLNIYLTRKISGDDVAYVRQLVREISLRIYKTDIDKSSRLR